MATRIRIDVRPLEEIGESFRVLSQNFPVERRNMAWRIGRFARDQVISTYVLDLPLDGGLRHTQPTHYKGTFGQGIRLFVTPQGTVTIRSDSPLTDQIELGRGPRSIDEGERAQIEEWASSKLGITEPRIVNAIVRRIANTGILARRLFFDALHPGTPRGRQVDIFINAQVEQGLNKSLNEAGFTP